MSRADRRIAARARVDWPVTLATFDGRTVDGRVVDASTSGVRVRLAEPDALAVGSAVTVTMIPVAAGDPLQAVARVVRCSAEDVALQFVGLPPIHAERVRGLVSIGDVRRRAPRASADLPASLELNSTGRHAARVLDLTPFSARVGVDAAVAPGTRVVLQLPLPSGGRPLRVPGVVWEGGPRGAIVLFVNLRPEVFRQVGALAASLLKP